MDEKLSNVLAELAAKFGTTVEHLWEVMLKQAAISGAMSLINIGCICIFAYIYYRYATWFFHKEKPVVECGMKSGMDEMGHPIIIGVAAVVVLAAIFCGVPSNLYDAITAFGNPEYWALRQILHR